MQLGATPVSYFPDWALSTGGKILPPNYTLVSQELFQPLNDSFLIFDPVLPSSSSTADLPSHTESKPVLRQELPLLLPPYLKTSLYCYPWQPLASCDF